MIQTIVCLSAWILIVSFTNCSPNHHFKAVERTLASSTNTKVYETSVNFGSQQTRALDIVWVIDNSGSMNEEAAHVRNNFTNFINSVRNIVDLRVAVISRAGTSGTSVSLPVSGSQYLHIDQTVGSHNGLQIAAAAICPTTNAGIQCSSIPSFASVDGHLRNFLRPGSKKVFIMVTDDESRVLSASNFDAIWNEVYGQELYTLFGFVGLGGGVSPCMAATGNVYIDLASASDGEVFNICNSDWTQTFSKLTNNVIILSIRPVALPDFVRSAEIVSVELNGQMISPSQYTITSEGLSVSPSIAPQGGQVTLRVHYN